MAKLYSKQKQKQERGQVHTLLVRYQQAEQKIY